MIEKQIKLIPYRVESTGYWESEIPQGVSMIHAPEAWEDNAGEDVVIAVIDSGVDVSHPDLKDAIIDGFNFTTDDSAAYQDENGHGTHVAGTIAAQQNNRGVVGVAPKAKLLVLKVLDKDGRKTLLHNMARLWIRKLHSIQLFYVLQIKQVLGIQQFVMAFSVQK